MTWHGHVFKRIFFVVRDLMPGDISLIQALCVVMVPFANWVFLSVGNVEYGFVLKCWVNIPNEIAI